MSNIVQIINSTNYPKRRRSNSLDLKIVSKYRENTGKVFESQIKKYASSGNLLNSENSDQDQSSCSPRVKPRFNEEGYYFLFVNWYKDYKSVKQLLLTLHDPNIFKSDFAHQNDLNLKEYPTQPVFLVCNNLKIENEYEAYLINGYSDRLKEFINWADDKKELFEECSRGLELLEKQQSEEKDFNQRRNSETKALIIQNKNQSMQSFFPREYQGLLSLVQFTCEFDIIYTNQEKRIDRNYKVYARYGILSNIDINIFTRNNLKLKDSYILRHLYLGQCNDTQIANVDSCLRIGGPFGNDMIIRFQNPQTRNQWNNYINENISTYQESIRNSSTTITVFNDTNQSSSVPLVSKSITISGSTVGLSLKKMAMSIFEIKDIDIKDLSIIFLIKNKENILHDDVSIMVLQEHVNNIQENNCVKSCLETDKLTSIVKIIYYLRSNKPPTNDLSKDSGKVKKINIIKSKEESKSKQVKYNIQTRWVDNEIPNWLMSLLSDLYNEGAKCEGIFRISGIVIQSDDYINQICESDDVKIVTSINTKASILKKFINMIDGSLLSTITKEQFTSLTNDINSVEEFNSQEDLQTKLLGIIQKIPPNNLNLFHHILVVLQHIIDNSQINQMNASNLSTCFSQNLFKHLSDDAVKINRLFECILCSISRIVPLTVYNNIVMSYEKRRQSIGSTESYTKSEGICHLEVDNSLNRPSTPITASDSADDSRLRDNQLPVVPPRRKKGVNRANTKFESSDQPELPPRRINNKFINKRQSLCEELICEKINNDIRLDDEDSKVPVPSKSSESNPLQRNNVNSRERKISRSRITRSVLESPPIYFQRQNQVNRKHQKSNPSTSENLNQTQTDSAKNNSNPSKFVPKLTRNPERMITKTRSRSQTKGADTSSASQISENSKFYTQIGESSSFDSSSSFNESKERRRSSSACRVSKLKEQYENPVNCGKPPPLPMKMVSVQKNVSERVKEIEERKKSLTDAQRLQRSRQSRDPVKPSHKLPVLNAQLYSPSPMTASLNNLFVVQDRLNDSNDDDVTFI